MTKKEDFFTRFTSAISRVLGHAWVFAAALLALILWAISGPFLRFSNRWQLIINTSTTIITFLMVFIIQNTQNRDNMALNIKLDTILHKLGVDKENLLQAEESSEKHLKEEMAQLRRESRRTRKHS